MMRQLALLLVVLVLAGCGRRYYEGGPDLDASMSDGATTVDCDALGGNDAFLASTGICYTFHRGPVQWKEAREACAGLGGNLVSLTSAAEASEVIDGFGLNEPIWMNLAYQDLDATWVWLTGESLTYTNWEEAPQAIDDMGAILSPTGTWRTVDGTHAYACEYGWTALGESAYALVTVDRTWALARDFCMSVGADLATFPTAADRSALAPLTRRHTWVGLHDPELDGTFVWLSGEQELDGWAFEEPDVGEDCAEFDSDAGFLGESCDATRPFLCERPAN